MCTAESIQSNRDVRLYTNLWLHLLISLSICCYICLFVYVSVSIAFVTNIVYVVIVLIENTCRLLYFRHIYKQMSDVCVCYIRVYVFFYCLHDKFIYICAFVYRFKNHFVYDTRRFFFLSFSQLVCDYI